jgi:hypothetical protein
MSKGFHRDRFFWVVAVQTAADQGTSLTIAGLHGTAMGIASIFAGWAIAIAGAPFLLGLLGDSFGISGAYIMVFVLISIAFVIVRAIPSNVEESV